MFQAIFTMNTDSVPAKQVPDVLIIMDNNSTKYTPGTNAR
ncbi:hypothetical protein SP19_78 [Salmonella phage 19]|nr:hypothetical protein SP19_78 [Salmonella phage 19]